ncbi:MAG: hypothetical protein HPY53_13450 [Brevinematales bacterium]|nr:hypothetical protein [Brevinematales bacterium]
MAEMAFIPRRYVATFSKRNGLKRRLFEPYFIALSNFFAASYGVSRFVPLHYKAALGGEPLSLVSFFLGSQKERTGEFGIFGRVIRTPLYIVN